MPDTVLEYFKVGFFVFLSPKTLHVRRNYSIITTYVLVE